VLLGASPGGTLANFLTHLARGDTALSISMTALSSVASVITVPLFLTLAVDHFDASVADDVSMLGVVARVFVITIIPLAIGMRIRARHPARALAVEPRARRAAFVVFAGVVLGAVINEFGTVMDHFTELALATLTLNVAAMTISFSVARLARLDDRQSTAIAMELGVHNAALAIAVGTSIDDVLAIPAAVYSVFQLLTAGAFARLMHRRNSVGAPDTLAAGAHAPIS
jgi:bile acid:Na+ symporter, BASS family